MSGVPPGRHIMVNAFNMSAAGHLCHGMWTHPRDRSADYTDIDGWVALAQTLERGKFDGLFLADVIGTNDVHDGSPAAALHHAVQVPCADPMMAISAMAHATRHLGFGVTSNLTYEKAYLLARRFSTLDHLTRGRIGWNIVTGYLDSTARAIGLVEQIRRDDRYAMADDFMDVVYKLWEGSWEDDAVLRDRAGKRFTDPAKVHRVVHKGPFYELNAIHVCEPSPQRTPLLYQAGGSSRGLAFAARHAECVFTASPTIAQTKRVVADLRQRAVDNGRRADDIRILAGMIVITARTEAEAQAKYAEYRHYASAEGGLVHFCSTIGVDLSRYGLDEPIRPGETQAMGAAVTSITKFSPDEPWTVRKLLDRMKLGARMQPIVGSASQVADQLIAYVDETGVDGFNLIRVVAPESYEDFADLVVPELQQRGRFKVDYAAGTLREKMFGQEPHLPARHYGKRFDYRASNAAAAGDQHAAAPA